jgi:hypothetical protein
MREANYSIEQRFDGNQYYKGFVFLNLICSYNVHGYNLSITMGSQTASCTVFDSGMLKLEITVLLQHE